MFLTSAFNEKKETKKFEILLRKSSKRSLTEGADDDYSTQAKYTSERINKSSITSEQKVPPKTAHLDKFEGFLTGDLSLFPINKSR